MAITRKSRVLPYTGPRSGYMWNTTKIPGQPVRVARSQVLNSTAFHAFDGSQVTVSENHPEWRTRKYGFFKWDIGGEFSSMRRYVEGVNPSAVTLSGTLPKEFDGSQISSRYSGPFLPQAPADCVFPPYANSSDEDLKQLGTTAIALASPVNPAANVSTFLGELLGEGFPKAFGAAFRELRGLRPRDIADAVSGEHLNLTFGWLPFVSDIKDITSAIAGTSHILEQLDRDSEKVVRRGWKFEPESSYDITPVSRAAYGPWTLLYNNTWYSGTKDPIGQVMREHLVTRTRWFSGAFVYYVPKASTRGLLTSDDVARKVLQIQRVLGANPTPDAVWNLLPWSWLVDWFVNAGDFLKNLDAAIFDNQVLPYGYMMEHTVSKYTYTLVGPYYLRDGTVGPVPPSVSMVSETKRRIKATPYGFGLTYDGLSAMQKSILAALGFTHGPR